MPVPLSYLKLVTQTERIPASAAARQATGTTSETCLYFAEAKLSILEISFKINYSCRVLNSTIMKVFLLYIQKFAPEPQYFPCHDHFT